VKPPGADRPICIHMSGTSSIAEGGGSNTFVRGLARRQASLGWRPVVVINERPLAGAGAATDPGSTKPRDGKLSIEPFETWVLPPITDTSRRAYYARSPATAPGVTELFEELRPSVVHFHTLNASAGLPQLRAAKRIGARTILTYHTGGISCPQTGLLENGRTPCDGALEVTRCTSCRLANRGIPTFVSRQLAKMDCNLSEEADATTLGRLMSSRTMTKIFIEGFRDVIECVDAFHLQAQWIAAVLRSNGVPDQKMAFVEMGYSQTPVTPIPKTVETFTKARPLKLVFAGRCSDIKGIETIFGALHRIPKSAPIRVSLLGSGWQTPYGRRLLRPFANDARLEPPRSVSAEAILSQLATYDACLVPSRWLETGPLAAYEAMAAGLPVIGSRLGGISERIRDGIDGLLFEPENTTELAAIITTLLANPQRLTGLQSNIRPQRTFDDMARELDGLYRSLP
jgi:glycosyltransferase involved in cell wall biosynthesis